MTEENDIKGIDKPFDEKGVLKFSNDRQLKIWQALTGLNSEFGPLIANIYEGAILTLNGDNPEKVSIVSHLARELSDILPLYVAEFPVRQVRTAGDQIGEIRKELNVIIKMFEDKSVSDGGVKELIEGLLIKIPEQTSQREQFKKVIDSHPVLGIRPTYLNDQFIKQWMNVNKYFVKNLHHNELKNQKIALLPDAELLLKWNTLETLIYRVLVNEPFFNAVQEIDRILKIDVPTEQDADELMRHVVEPQHRKYFFDRCDNPNWLELLNKRGTFSSPQEPLKKDGYIQFLPWPESKYLAKAAKKKPQEVYDIIKNLTTDNSTILYDFLQSALQSPAEIAAHYADTIIKKKWVHGLYTLRLPDEIAELMENLAKEGKAKQALKLADELFSLRVEKPIQTFEKTSELSFLSHPDAKPYFDEWHYAEIIHNKTKELALLKPVELFGIYTQKLQDAIELEKRENMPDSFYEYSHIWRPNIFKARNMGEDAKNILLDGIIGLMEQYQNDQEKLKAFVATLKKRSYALFRRIEMVLYKYKPDAFILESGEILRKKEIIIAYNLRREYLPLLEIMYSKISAEEQADILKAIEDGPDFTQHDDVTDEQFERMVARWKSLYFDPIKDSLPKAQMEEYTEIVKKYGKPVDDDGEIVTWDGGKSPISSEELSNLSAEKTIQYFEEYKMPDDPFGHHSTGGLGMIFSGLVSENPEKYISVTKLFFDKKIRPIYFYHLIG